MEDAGIAARDVNYVNLHGTSTQLNDRIETRALKLALGDDGARTPMSSLKSQIGHPQGASGAAGIAATLVAMAHQQIPPTINLEKPDPDCDLDYVPEPGRKVAIEHAVCNCIAFGSKNSALVLRKLCVTASTLRACSRQRKNDTLRPIPPEGDGCHDFACCCLPVVLLFSYVLFRRRHETYSDDSRIHRQHEGDGRPVSAVLGREDRAASIWK